MIRDKRRMLEDYIEPHLYQRNKRKLNGCGITPWIRYQPCISYVISMKFSQTIHSLFLKEPKKKTKEYDKVTQIKPAKYTMEAIPNSKKKYYTRHRSYIYHSE